ncbi:MAG: hypothetical protein ACRCZI_00380, partial [Cetobacterium sp.]
LNSITSLCVVLAQQDALSGGDKHYGDRCFLMANHEKGNVDNATMDEEGFEICPAKEMEELLGS